MKLSNATMSLYLNSLTTISSKVKGKLAYCVARNIRKLSSELTEFEKIKNEYICEHGTETNDGRFMIETNSDEYKNYKKLKEEVKSNLELKEKLETFEKHRYEVQVAAISEGKKDVEKVSNMQQLYAELIANEVMKQYFDAELKFNVMLGDVNKIISESVEDVIR